MSTMMSACGVMCSDCPAYHGAEKGAAHQERVVEAWRRIYGLDVTRESIDCGGCLAPDDQVFYTSRTCQARLCCRSKGFASCAECSEEACPDLAKAQAVWDGVPEIAKKLSPEDSATYAQPYCDHRRRLAEARRAIERSRKTHL